MERRATREEIDQIAWTTIKTATVYPGPPYGYAHCGRPANYAELDQMIADLDGDFEHSWSEFLHEFFRYRTAEFFAEPPPKMLSPAWRVVLAGTAEYLSNEFGLPVPAWTEGREYFLPEIWDPLDDLGLNRTEFEEMRRAQSHESFLRRNVIFKTRNLITL